MLFQDICIKAGKLVISTHKHRCRAGPLFTCCRGRRELPLNSAAAAFHCVMIAFVNRRQDTWFYLYA